MKTNAVILFLINSLFIACQKENLSEISPRSVLSSKNAKEGVPPVPCSPIQSAKVRGDLRAGETGLSTIDLTYAVQSCDAGKAVTVSVEIIQWSTKTVLESAENLELKGKYHFQRTGLYGIYYAKLIVKDAATGEILVSGLYGVSLVSKGV